MSRIRGIGSGLPYSSSGIAPSPAKHVVSHNRLTASRFVAGEESSYLASTTTAGQLATLTRTLPSPTAALSTAVAIFSSGISSSNMPFGEPGPSLCAPAGDEQRGEKTILQRVKVGAHAGTEKTYSGPCLALTDVAPCTPGTQMHYYIRGRHTSVLPCASALHIGTAMCIGAVCFPTQLGRAIEAVLGTLQKLHRLLYSTTTLSNRIK